MVRLRIACALPGVAISGEAGVFQVGAEGRTAGRDTQSGARWRTELDGSRIGLDGA